MTSRLPKWISWIWPRQLVGQIAVVVALALLIAQTLNVFLLMGERQIEQLGRRRDMAETSCTSAAKAIYLAPERRREEEARRLSTSWLTLTFSNAGLRRIPSLTEDAPLARRVEGALRSDSLVPYMIEAGTRPLPGGPQQQDLREIPPNDRRDAGRSEPDPRFGGPPPRRFDGPPPRRLDEPPPRRFEEPPPRRFDEPPPRRFEEPPPRRFDEPPPRPRDELRYAGMEPWPVRPIETVVAIQFDQRSNWLTCRVISQPEDPFISLRLLSGTLALYAFVLGATILITRRLGRPLSQLAVAASQIGRGDKVSPIEATGPKEVAAAAQAFNEMNARITQLLSEKDAMLGAIGHDLRTPLTSLRIRAENLPPSGEVERMIATIGHLSKMLDGILQLAQLGKQEEAPVATDVGLLVTTMVEEFEDLGADVTFKPSPRVLHNLRPHLCMRLLRNLIENAVKYGERARVSLETKPHRLMIHIDDDGPGLDPNVLERIMQPFERLEASRNRQTGGAGLGLAIARGIADLHDARIDFKNRTEGGLRVTVSIPAR